MTSTIENIAPPPPSKAADIVRTLRALPNGQCVTLLPETDQKKDLDRQRVLWYVSATRAGISVISRRATTKEGHCAIRIWRTDYP